MIVPFVRRVWRVQIEEGQITQWTKEEGQITQWTKEEGQTTQWTKEEGQTTQWTKEEGQRYKQRSTKHTHKTKGRLTRTPLNRGWTEVLRKGKQFLLVNNGRNVDLHCSKVLFILYFKLSSETTYFLSREHDFTVHE